jgi:GNAT superfamily N-acetyltransferase
MARRDDRGAVNVRLRPITAEDAPWLDRWLALAGGLTGTDVVDPARPGESIARRLKAERSLIASVVERDADPSGIVLLRSNTPRSGAATFELVAVEPRHARRGVGQRAAALAEDALPARTRVLYAPAPATHGISLYFWIRLGYRPLLRAGWPCERAGIAWLARERGVR